MYRGCFGCEDGPTRPRLLRVSSMVALLAHSFGVGFRIMDKASKALLAGRHRHPGVVLYGRRRRGNAELRAGSTAPDLARVRSLLCV